MPTKMNRKAYEELVREDLEWLRWQIMTLERDHVIAIVEASADLIYGESGAVAPSSWKNSFKLPGSDREQSSLSTAYVAELEATVAAFRESESTACDRLPDPDEHCDCEGCSILRERREG